MPAWPGTLPQFVQREGFREGFKNVTIRSQMDSGASKRRRRFTDGPEERQYPIELTGAQLTIFRTFFNTDLAGGALSFTMDDPRTGVNETYAFLQPPEPATALGPDSYIVTMKLEKLL